MEQRCIPGFKVEGLSVIQPQPSSSPTVAYREILIPSGTNNTYQHQMHNLFTGFGSFGSHQADLVHSPAAFGAQSFTIAPFTEQAASTGDHHQHPAAVHQRIEQSSNLFPFTYNAITPSITVDSRRLNQHGLSTMMDVFGGGQLDGPSSSSSNELLLQADKLCAVCNDRAVCQHYGARTCEGCKGFFKRTVQKKAQYVCTGNKNCTIDKRFRSRCQYCRFQKCIAVGMVKEVVRYGSLSGRRGRLPSKTKIQHADDPPSPPLSLLTLLSKAYAESRADSSTNTYDGSVQQILIALEEEFRFIKIFVDKIPGAVEITPEDINELSERNFFPLLALKLCNRLGESSILRFELFNVDPAMVPAPINLLFRLILDQAARFRRLIQWDSQSFAALYALQFLRRDEDANSPPLCSEPVIDRLRGTITNALKDHCCGSSPPNSKKLQTIIAQIDEFSRFQDIGYETMSLAESSGLHLPPHLGAMLRVSKQMLASSSKLDFGLFAPCQ